jgi:hypothetical protein
MSRFTFKRLYEASEVVVTAASEAGARHKAMTMLHGPAPQECRLPVSTMNAPPRPPSVFAADGRWRGRGLELIEIADEGVAP